MKQIEESELCAGFVPFLMPDILRDDPRSQTNAKLIGRKDYSVKGGHPFLILGLLKGLWHAVPVFSIDENEGEEHDRHHLVAGLKEGLEHGWRDKLSYVFKWQHWLLPTSAILDASCNDTSAESTRRFYAQAENAELSRIRGYLERAREPFRPATPAEILN